MSDTYGHTITLPGLVVISDLSAKQYHGVKMASTADTIIALGATTDVAVGVLMDAPDASGEAATVASLGVVPLVAGTSVLTAGARFMFDSTGRAIAASGKDYGQVLETPGATGDFIRGILD